VRGLDFFVGGVSSRAYFTIVLWRRISHGYSEIKLRIVKVEGDFKPVVDESEREPNMRVCELTGMRGASN
jgi:hypothetical protein